MGSPHAIVAATALLANASHGGYGATLPSKFISADGRTLWLQSNVCPCAPAGMSVYDFALRRLDLGQ